MPRHKRAQFAIAALLVGTVATAVLMHRHARPPEVTAPMPADTASTPGPATPPAPPAAIDAHTVQPTIPPDAPQVRAYLATESERQRLEEYFSDPQAQEDSADAIWALIGKLEQEQRVVSMEALSMKLEWLRLNSADEAEFHSRAEALVASYRQQAKAYSHAHDPTSTAAYAQYHAAEQRIVAEVNAMQSFPPGETRQSYLRKRLLQARIAAYGQPASDGSSVP